MDKDTSNMKPNPKEKANIFSQILFWWIINVFRKGELEESDIYRPLKSDNSENVTDHLERFWNRELEKLKKLEYTVGNDGQKVPLKKDARPKLYKAIFRAFWFQYFLIGILVFIQSVILRTVLPILQGWVINYFMESNVTNKTKKSDAMIYAGCLVICSIISVTMFQQSFALMQQVGMRMRVACSSLLYRKLLRLSKTSLSQTGAGQIVNLLSNDVNRFDQLLAYLNFIWIMPFQVIVVGYIMWLQIGISTLVGIGSLLIITLLIQGNFSLLSHKLRAAIAPLTDRRVQLMSELITGIQVVKMYAWEKPFSKIVSVTRALEINKIKFSSYVRGSYIAIMVFTERVTLYLTLITYSLMGNDLTADITYVLATFFNVLQLTTALFFPQALILLGETIISMKRLEEFLLLDEISTDHVKDKSQYNLSELSTVVTAKNQRNNYISNNETFLSKSQRTQESVEHPVYIELHRVCANWINGQLPPTLCNVSMNIQPGTLCALIGTVGSGKSSVLHLLLNELNLGAGSVTFTQGLLRNDAYNQLSSGYIMDNPNLRISYASQDPWLFGGTVKDNILFGQPYDKIRYAQVTKVCALSKDFQQLPHGDMTIVGDRGVSLSGGQRARINLARAVYRQADVYLLDDPLSAVDTHVAQHLYKKCIIEYLSKKTRILVTHQLQFLKQADHIVMLDRGFVKMQGNYNQLAEANTDFIEMMNSLMTSHEMQKKEESSKRTSELSIKRTSVLTRRPSALSTASSTAYSDTDYLEYTENSSHGEEIAHGQVSRKVYTEYLHHGGSYFIIFLLFLFFVISQISTSGNDYWVAYWTDIEDLRRSEGTVNANRSNHEYKNLRNNSFLASIFTLNSDGLISTTSAIYVYTFCIIACTFFTLFRSFFFMTVCMISSKNLHNVMFSNLLQARMSFFHSNPSGRILNRFSKDVGTMDELLPRITLDSLQVCFVICSILILEAVINYWMLIPIVIIALIFILAIRMYIKTAQNLRRLEGITKSPIFSHVNSTLNGLATIRSSGVATEKMMQKQFDVLQDYHSGAWYLVIISSSAFGFMLDLITCVFTACICFSFLLSEQDNISSGDVGLAISQSLILTGTLQHGARQSTEAISLMTSVERILQYTNLPKEKSTSPDNIPPPTWPTKGLLTLKNVNLKYNNNDPPVLKNLNVYIEPGWKVGVVGRTGAGKSSLISALFRLFDEGLEGEIKIDDRDTSTVDLCTLRSKISIIPQESVLFSESLRYNLDPFNQYNDTLLWEVLRQVELNDVGLDHIVLYGGFNFSVGQRQLICLARAILRNNRLLVLDEATANIDSHTDALIQNTIKSKFKDCTVITIAHRLNTIIDSDRIIVMENGCIVEFGTPYELLRDLPKGYFSQMVGKTGSQMAQNLYNQAEIAYRENIFRQNLSLSTQNSRDSDTTIAEITEESSL